MCPVYFVNHVRLAHLDCEGAPGMGMGNVTLQCAFLIKIAARFVRID